MTAPPPAGAWDDDALAEAYAPPQPTWLRVNFVTSVDGAVEQDGRSGGLSNPIDQRLMQVLRMRSDAVLLGAGTFRIERYGATLVSPPRQACRRDRGLPEHPALVIVSGSLDLDPRSPAFAAAPRRPLVLTHAAAPAARRAALAPVADVLVAGEDRIDFAAGLAQLRSRGLRHILCEGGPHLLGALTAADLVDEVCLTLSPVLAGPGAGRITAGPPTPARWLALHQVFAADGTLFLSYRRRTGRGETPAGTGAKAAGVVENPVENITRLWTRGG